MAVFENMPAAPFSQVWRLPGFHACRQARERQRATSGYVFLSLIFRRVRALR
jgi:hypothetical protein